MPLFGSTHVYFSPLVLAQFVELLRPVVMHLHHEAPGPLRLQDTEHLHHGQLVRLLAEVDVGAVTPGVTCVLCPGIILGLPTIKLLTKVHDHAIHLLRGYR